MTNRATVIDALKTAKTELLAEQSRHRSQIEMLQDTDINPFQQICWADLLKAMKECRHPPASEDWKDHGGDPNRARLEAIPDEEVRYAIYMHMQISEHTDRIRSLAAFYRLAGGRSDHIDQIFEIWAIRSRYASMVEQLPAESGRRDVFTALVRALDLIGENVSRAPLKLKSLPNRIPDAHAAQREVP